MLKSLKYSINKQLGALKYDVQEIEIKFEEINTRINSKTTYILLLLIDLSNIVVGEFNYKNLLSYHIKF